MRAGFVFADFDNRNVLCFEGNGVELVPADSSGALNRAICLSSRTEMKNIQEKLKEKGVIDDLYIINIGALYKRVF